jgi:hypothetical protein
VSSTSVTLVSQIDLVENSGTFYLTSWGTETDTYQMAN